MLSLQRIPIRRQQILLLFVDLCILLVSLPLAVLIRGAGAPIDMPPLSLANLPDILVSFLRYYTGATTISACVFITLFFLFDLYSTERRTRSAADLLYILCVCGLGVLSSPVFFYFAPDWKLGRGLTILQGAIVAVGAFAWRAVFSKVHRKIGRTKKILVVGAGMAGQALLEEIHASFANELTVVGIVDDDPAKANFELNGFRVIGGTRDVGRLVRETGAEILVFAIPRQNNAIDSELMGDILRLKTTGVEVYQMPTFFKKITGRVPVEFVEQTWLIFNQDFAASEGGLAARARRLFDLVVSAGLLVVLTPLILVIAAAIKLTSRGPVLYRQERLGLNRRPYEMLKFRSMVVDAEKGISPVWSSGKADTRVTRLGRILRRTRMDEIPNFLNVLRGEMSLVGPRPERAHFVEHLEEAIPYYGLRFAVKPGMTGWAQVNYSYGSSVEDACRKLQYEMFYIQERSLLLDAIILLKTAQTVMLRPGS